MPWRPVIPAWARSSWGCRGKAMNGQVNIPPRYVTMSRMRQAPFLLSLFLMSIALIRAAEGDEFSVDLLARVDNQQQTVRGQEATAAPASGSTRPVLTAKSKSTLRIRWSIVYEGKTASIPDVTVHLVLDKENTIGQRVVPKPGPDVVYESALIMDFGPQAKGSADFVIEVPESGSYLLRLETIGAAKTHGHEHFAAMDLKVP